MPYGKLNILVLWGDDKRRELDATGAVDLLDRAQLDHRPSRHRQVLHTAALASITTNQSTPPTRKRPKPSTAESPVTAWPRLTPRSRTSSLAHMGRITIDPAVMGGVPCLRGLRIPVSTVVNMVAGGMTAQQIVDELPPLEIEDVAAALRFAADAVADREIPLQPTA
jgi:uncharacterized protein (DUF433 family)